MAAAGLCAALGGTNEQTSISGMPVAASAVSHAMKASTPGSSTAPAASGATASSAPFANMRDMMVSIVSDGASSGRPSASVAS